MNREKLKEQLISHEGRKNFPYIDTMGKMTIGVGRNLTDRGITYATIDQMLEEDIDLVEAELNDIYPDWCDLSEARQLVLANMMFNLGKPRYLTFNRFWGALRASQYDVAAEEMLDSRWARQVKGRSEELAEMMRDG